MVVDTSALVAILTGEPRADAIIATLASADDPLISAGSLLEASIVMEARTGEDGVADLDELVTAAGLRCVAVDAAQVHVARDAFRRYGKGRHPAGLNFGYCFTYALAATTGRSVLFVGEDFTHTDLVAA